MTAIAPITLRGKFVTLEPLTQSHHDGLVAAAPDGSLRDTVVFSILPAEWPQLRSGLDYRLARTR